MRRLMLSAAAAALLAAPVAAGAADYTFALVPKNVNNPFFDQARDGCKKAEAELNGVIECRYIGPGEHGGGEEQLQMVNDLIQSGIDGLAVSPSNAASMASALAQAKAAGIPGADLGQRPVARERGPQDRLRRHQELRHRRQPRQDRAGDQAGRRHDLHPVGRCRGGQPQRAHAGHPRHARRQERHHLAGRAAWPARTAGPRSTAARSTPTTTSRARCSRWRTSSRSYPDLDAFVPTGGFPQFVPDAYRNVATKVKDRIDSKDLALVVADTLPVQMDLMKDGLSLGQVGQRPFEMGYKTMYFLLDIVKDGKNPEDPTYTGLDVCTPETADSCIGG